MSDGSFPIEPAHRPDVRSTRFPASAAWRHYDARTGLEVAHIEWRRPGHRIFGCTTALESGQCWTVEYELHIDENWTTRRAVTTSRFVAGARRSVLDADGHGRWWVDGDLAEHLDGCLDVDLESSALTNALPVHRLALGIGQGASAPAAYVRAPGLAVDRLEQTYLRRPDGPYGHIYNYSAPIFGFTCRLTYDKSGLVVEYPGIAVRAT